MKLFLVLGFVLYIGSVRAQSNADEPPVQAGEDVGNFSNQWGLPPKNDNSAQVGGVQMQQPFLNGSGCPNGTVGATLTPDNKTLSLLFDNYVVQAGQSVGVKKNVKQCTILVPVTSPPGFQFTIVKLDYRGFNSIPVNGRTRYVTIYSFIDAQTGQEMGKRIRRRFDFQGPLADNYVLSSDVAQKPFWSKCGSQIQLRIDTRAVAVTNQNNEDVMGTIDSIDSAVGTSAEYHLLWQVCNDSAGGGGVKPGWPTKPGHGGGKPPVGPIKPGWPPKNPGHDGGGNSGGSKPPGHGDGGKPPIWGGPNLPPPPVQDPCFGAQGEIVWDNNGQAWYAAYPGCKAVPNPG